MNYALKRLLNAKLIVRKSDDNEIKLVPITRSCEEFLIHGVKFAFPPEFGSQSSGIPTAYAGPPLQNGQPVMAKEYSDDWKKTFFLGLVNVQFQNLQHKSYLAHCTALKAEALLKPHIVLNKIVVRFLDMLLQLAERNAILHQIYEAHLLQQDRNITHLLQIRMQLFDFSPATITGIENKTISGKEAMKRLAIYCNVPEAALYESNKNRFKIDEEKMRSVEKRLRFKINLK